MNDSVTINTRTFAKSKVSPDGQGQVRSCISRGLDLPDEFVTSYKETANLVDAEVKDTRSLRRFNRSYLDADGKRKEVSFMVQMVIPSDAPSSDVAAVVADAIHYFTGATTVTQASLDAVYNREI
jgi:hypothetical protein